MKPFNRKYPNSRQISNLSYPGTCGFMKKPEFSILLIIILISIHSLTGFAFSHSEAKGRSCEASLVSYLFVEVDEIPCQNFASSHTTPPPGLKVSNLSKDCTSDKKHYTILFEISGGNPASFSVIDKSTGKKTGSLYGGFFESDLIAAGKHYSFLISDGSGSEPIIVEGTHSCGKATSVAVDPVPEKKEGEKQKAMPDASKTAPVAVDLVPEKIEDKKPTAKPDTGKSAPEKVVVKPASTNIPKSDSKPVAATPKKEISKKDYPPIKVFNLSRSCVENKRTYSVFFEISGGNPDGYVVIDNETGKATGSLFFSFFESDPVPSGTAYSYSVFDTNGSAKVLVEGSRDCGGSSVNKSGTGSGQLAGSEQKTTPKSTIASPKKTTTTVSPAKSTNSTKSPDLPIEIKYSNNSIQHVLKVRSLSKNCTDDGANYTLLFEITGGIPSAYKVIDNSTKKPTGSLFAGFFESDLIPSGTVFSYSIFDTNGSDTTVIEGSHTCGKTSKLASFFSKGKNKDKETKNEKSTKKGGGKKSMNSDYAASLFADGPGYDELSIFIDVPPVGGGEIDVVIKDQDVYLPIVDLFDFLKVKNVPSHGLDSISGFFINQTATFVIDRINNKIEYDGNVYELKPDDLIRTDWNLYLNGDVLGEVFGLNCKFSFRNMSVKVLTKLELPVIREMRRAEMRQNLKHLTGEIKTDTTIKRRYPFFYMGVADWSANVTEQINERSEARVNLSLGSVIAGGEASASLNFNSHSEFTEKQQYYLWRRVNNDRKVLRQVKAGKIAPGATSSIFNPVVGAQITNTPTTFRRSFGSYTLSDVTEPGWIVELYVNNVMIDYVKADAAGFFSFEVPLVYGNSLVRLKFYGPWGEERTREQNVTIPFSFIPVNQLEYTLSAGVVEDTIHSRFSKANINYGLARRITLGAGVEYLSSVTTGPIMPYMTGTFRVASNILLMGEYNHGIRSRGSLSYRLPSSIQINIDYSKYDEGQKAINYSYLEERKISVSAPIRLHHFNAYNRISISQLVLPTSKFTNSEWLFSGSLYKMNMNITTYAFFIPKNNPYVYSFYALSYRLPRDYTMSAQVQYGYGDNKLISAKVGMEKRVFKHGFLQLSYEQNFKSNLYMGEIGFRYDFDFAQTGFSSRQSENATTLVQYARGSLIYDRKTKYLDADKLSSVSKGGITFIPFIDKNGNGKLDDGEPRIPGLNLRTTGGRIERSEKDTIIRVLGLEPYTEYFISLDQNSLDNIAWRLKYKTLTVAVVPNMLKTIEVPIYVVGEAAGTVMMDKKGELYGLSRVIINFYDKDNNFVGKTLSEDDGYFSYFGLEPGPYTARVDEKQLGKLNLMATPDKVKCKIASVLDGDYVDGLDFVIEAKQREEAEEVD